MGRRRVPKGMARTLGSGRRVDESQSRTSAQGTWTCDIFDAARFGEADTDVIPVVLEVYQPCLSLDNSALAAN